MQRGPLPPDVQIGLLILACLGVVLTTVGVLIDAHFAADVGEAMEEITLPTVTATMALIAVRVLPGK